MNEWTQGLSLAQRIKRRINLTLGWTYTHPDGRIEMEWDEAAGIKPSDDEFESDKKFKSWLQNQDVKKIKGSRIAAVACFSISAYLATPEKSLIIAIFVAGGVYNTITIFWNLMDLYYRINRD
jgi:hypothetical protein